MTDPDVLTQAPASLQELLRECNGFILHHGALHVRGACREPGWHSIRSAWHGELAFSELYPEVLPTDVPFAQDQVGDQYLLRDDRVVHLEAETGETQPLAESLSDFFIGVEQGIEEYLNVGLGHRLQPGQLLHAYPPFCVEAETTSSLRPCSADELIRFHAEFAAKIRDLPDGETIQIVLE